MKVIIYNTKDEALADQVKTYDLLTDSEKYIYVDPNGVGPSIPSTGVYYSRLYADAEETTWALSADEAVENLLGKTAVESTDNWIGR